MANAKLKVFEEALLEDELEKDFELPELEVPKIEAEERTSQWVHSNRLPTRKVSRSERNHEPLSTPEQIKLPLRPTPKEGKSEETDLLPELHVLNPDLPQQQSTDGDRVERATKYHFQSATTYVFDPFERYHRKSADRFAYSRKSTDSCRPSETKSPKMPA